MKVYKNAHMKIFSPCIISKTILEKEFTRGITHFPVLVKNILNVLHIKNNSVQNQEHKQHHHFKHVFPESYL